MVDEGALAQGGYARRRLGEEVRGAPEGEATWRLVDEGGAVREGRSAGSALALPRLEPGYHRLAVAAGGLSSEATLIAAPARCWEPRAFTEGARAWGLAAQLYSFRSGGDLGIGTYADAGEAAA